jgi:hypothetical protein
VRDQVIVWAVVVALLGMGAASREAAAQANTSAHLNVPSHIRLAPAFTEIVAEMFKRSPRFRAQWEALVTSPRVRIAVRLDLRSRPYRARSILSRHEYGLISAVVELPPFGDHVELIAHEFEHIIEQLEGVELRRLAQDPSAGVHDLRYAYETERAYKVGQQVARECRRHPDRIAKALR